MATISGLANDIFTTEFASDTGVMTFSQISGWLAANIGNLNNLLNTSFSGAAPDIDTEAGAILKTMYMANFYRRESSNALRGIMTNNQARILSIAEGDSRVSFTNQKEVGRELKALADSYNTEVQSLAAKYCTYYAAPKGIDGADYFWPIDAC